MPKLEFADLSKDIEILNLSKRIENLLRSAGVNTIDELVYRQDDLDRIEYMGPKSIAEINRKLAEYEGR